LEYEGICRQFIPEEGKEHICIPLIIAGKPGAVVQFTFDTKKTDEEVEEIHEKVFKAESYIKNSLSVIETKQLMHTLRESSLIDGLTGLYNRRFLQDHSNQLIAGVLRRQKQISLLMCDMDFFKQVNDTYGHDAGDSLLKETSAIFRKSIRESDIVIRFGGEEFLILLVDTEPEYGFQVAEKIRKKVEETKFKVTNTLLQKTISIGISEFPKDTDGFWKAIKFADVALYKAKESGRNKCVKFTAELWEEKDNF
jgi:diguanylate cyclase (GGDEF)-like protein